MRQVFSPFLPQRDEDPWVTGINHLVSGFFNGQRTLAEREEREAKKELLGQRAALYRMQGELMQQKAEQEQLQRKAFETLPQLIKRFQTPAALDGNDAQAGDSANSPSHADVYGQFLNAFGDPKEASQALIGMMGGKADPSNTYALTLAQGHMPSVNQAVTRQDQLNFRSQDALGDLQKARINAADRARPADHGPSLNQALAQTYRSMIDQGKTPQEALLAVTPKSLPSEKPLSSHAQTELKGMSDKINHLNNILKDFRPDYAGSAPGVGTAANFLGNLGWFDNKYQDQAKFWQAVDTMDQDVRHELYGSAFTATEQRMWNRTTIHTWMSPRRVRENIEARLKILSDAYDRRVAFHKEGGTADAARKMKPVLDGKTGENMSVYDDDELNIYSKSAP